MLGKPILAGALALILFAPLDSTLAGGSRVLYSFSGSDGMYPLSDLVRDRSGNLYGTTFEGGANGNGIIFRLAPDGTLTVLFDFAQQNTGNRPYAGVIADKQGNLFGTTYYGGASNVGTVYELIADGSETVLHSFGGGSDGAHPAAALIPDKAGNLYGTTPEGGGTGCGGKGCGIVFRIAPDGTETILHAFASARDGAAPNDSLILGGRGNLFGTTTRGGAHGCGTVFEISHLGTATVLYSFAGGSDGSKPYANLAGKKRAGFFGTTSAGGATGDGTVFSLSPDGGEAVLHAFTGGNDGVRPYAGVVPDSEGNLYGTTYSGGANRYGTVFRLAPDGTETVLHAFAGGSDGAGPNGLIADGHGHLYGTTLIGGGTGCGGSGCGTVFEVRE